MDLLSDIESMHKSKKFSAKPLGPIGMHIHVLQPKYRTVIENTLLNILGTFIVDNASDRDILRALIKTKYPRMISPRTITMRFSNKLYDTSRFCVEKDARALRLMDTFETNDPNVMNCIIEQCKVERILLVDDIEYASFLTSKLENVPKNLLKVILTDPFSEYFPAPRYRSYADTLKVARFLTVDANHQEM